jgi:hypothetical protein
MPTPQMTLRVNPVKKRRWKEAAEMENLSVSASIHLLMDRWCDVVLGEESNEE